MDDRLAAIEAQLARLGVQLADVQARVAVLETRPHAAAPADLGTVAGGGEWPAGAARAVRPDAQAVLTALGRGLIVLGGAYLLRAVTEAHLVPVGAGVLLGLAYAGLWLRAAAQSGRKGRALDAGFHGGVALLIGFPLLVEATIRFGILSATAAAGALTGLAGLCLWVSWRERLHALAWFTVIATLGTGLVLMARTGAVLPYATCFVLVGVATLWLGYDREWILLRWPTSFVADAIVAGLVGRVVGGRMLDPPELVLAVQVLLFTSYLGSIALRTLVRGRDVIPFEVVQTAAVLIVGLGGGIVTSHAANMAVVTGWVAVALAIGAYGVAFAFVARRRGHGVNFYFYSSLALVCALTGSVVLPPATSRAVLWATLAVATTIAGGRLRRAALAFHGAVYLLAAALASGLLQEATARLVGPPVSGGLGWPPLVAFLAAAILCALRPVEEPGLRPIHARIPGVVSGAVLFWSTAGLATGLALAALEGLRQAPMSAGAAATVRTAVLSAGAMTAAWLGARSARSLFGLFAYPTLVLTGVKFVFEDLRQSEPGTLFVALALYGVALLAAPRLARRTAALDASEAPPASPPAAGA